MEPIIIIGSICLLIYGLVKLNKNSRERKMMIQMGLDPSQKEAHDVQENTLGLLKWGIVLAGIGLGLFLAEILEQYAQMDKDAMYVAFIFIFGGVSFILSHLIVSHQSKKQSEKKDLEK